MRGRRKISRKTARKNFFVHMIMKSVFMLLVICIAVLVFFTKSAAVTASAEDSGERYKYYTTVYVDRDTTLWSVAETYISEEYEDIRAYIDEVKFINHLQDDSLMYGTVISVPYYSDELK